MRDVEEAFNQFTETFTVLGLARLVQQAAGELGLEVAVEHSPNPRVEEEEHYYNPVHTKLFDLGLRPHFLRSELVHSIIGTVRRHQARVVTDRIAPRTQWRPAAAGDGTQSELPLGTLADEWPAADGLQSGQRDSDDEASTMLA